jgi:glucose-1-phosphate thymidylyltransferase
MGKVNRRSVCPFHDDKHPSPHLNATKNIFKCFSCGKGIDVIGLVMQVENLKYLDACQWLIDQFNVNVIEETNTKLLSSNTNLSNQTNNLSVVSAISAGQQNSSDSVIRNATLCSAENSCSKYKKPITVVDDGTETNETRLGAVCDLLYAMDKLHIDDDLLVVAADNLLFFSFQEFVDFAKEKGTSCIMCHEQPSIEKLQRTGVVELDSEMKVLGMEEKPQVPKSHWAVPPFYIYLKKDLDLVRHSVENGCGKDAPGNLAHYMVEHTTMHAWPMSAGRFDIGSLDTYYEAVRLYGNEHE